MQVLYKCVEYQAIIKAQESAFAITLYDLLIFFASFREIEFKSLHFYFIYRNQKTYILV